jgi:hypothetical protein
MHTTIDVVLNKMGLQKSRVAELAVGLSANQVIVWAFDYFIYPVVIYKFGILKGGIVMTLVSFVACLLSLWFYDWLKRDWLGIEAIKNLKGYGGAKKVGRFTAWVMKKSDPVVFLFLSINFDPFITTIYMRHGKYNGMTRRDWLLFTGSLILSNAYWTIFCFTGISLFEWAWKTIAN